MNVFSNQIFRTQSETGSAIERIAGAATALQLATRQHQLAAQTVAAVELRAAVQVAVYDLDVSWQSVGDTLGIRRGNAYQRLRRRPALLPAGVREGPAL